MKEIISTPNAPAAIGPYSQAVRAGSLLFVSGQIPLDPASGQLVENTIQAQAARSLENLKDFVEMNRVYKTYFPENCPARSAVQVARLPKDVLVEIEAIAVL